MIKIQNLTKTYFTKKTKCEALNDVSFILPETGLVFIIGKSGSGKSTLLNMLGGLDKPTSGDISVDGKKYSEFTVKDFDNFRNEKLGFVFQDFCLIENLTVRQNAELALDLQGKQEKDAVLNTLQSVGLEDLGDRYPKELSAGQKQRAAIARAIVKNTKILLADEPTGNIDSKSAEIVLNILKELSTEKLVVVISHNTDDAKKYGDRILEISDGKIIEDITREEGYSNKFEVNLPEINLPYNKHLTSDELVALNESVRLSKGSVIFCQRGSGFSDTVQPENKGGLGAYSGKGMSAKKVFGYSAAFFKKRWFGATLTAVIISFLMIVFGMAQLFSIFDGRDQVQESIAKYGDNGIMLKQGYYEDGYAETLKSDKYLAVDEKGIEEIKKVYDGNVYTMYKRNITIDMKNFDMDCGVTYGRRRTFEKGLATASNGVLSCDLQLLKRLFGNSEGNIEVLAGELKDTGGGVVLTDYIADSLLFYDVEKKYNGDYTAILTEEYISGRLKADAIIKTDYKEKYKDKLNNFLSGKKVDYKDLSFIDFYNDLVNRLSVCYSLNPDFKSAYLDTYCDTTENDRFAHAEYTSVFTNEEQSVSEFAYVTFSNEVADDEIYLSCDIFNRLFGTMYGPADIDTLIPSVFDGLEVTLKCGYEGGDEIYFRDSFKVKGLIEFGYYKISQSYLRELKENEILPYAIYLDDSGNAMEVLKTAEANGFVLTGNMRYDLIRRITGYVGIFKDIFVYIAVAVCSVIIFLLALNSFNNIKRNSYEIGVIRSMGGRTGQLSGIFALHTLATSLLICILTAIGNFLGVLLFNNVLVDSLSDALKTPGIADISILSFNPGIVALDIAIILILTLISAVVPVLSVRKIQPIKIIRARE